MSEPQDIADVDLGEAADEEGLCACGKYNWAECGCGAFFEEWICGMEMDGQCSMAGSEECDFECPVMRDLRFPKDKP